MRKEGENKALCKRGIKRETIKWEGKAMGSRINEERIQITEDMERQWKKRKGKWKRN